MFKYINNYLKVPSCLDIKLTHSVIFLVNICVLFIILLVLYYHIVDVFNYNGKNLYVLNQ